MQPYRSNSNTPPDTINGHPVKVLSKEVFDIDVKITYQDAEEVAFSKIMKFEGHHETDEVHEVFSDPKPHEIISGISKYHDKIDCAAKYSRLWIDESMCVPWHRIITIEIIKKVARTVKYRYIIKEH